MKRILIISAAQDGPSAAALGYDETKGQRLIDILRGAGVHINAPCGGGGRCGRCAVYIAGDVLPADKYERELLDNVYGSQDASALTAVFDGRRYALRLACRAVPRGDCEVRAAGYNGEYIRIVECVGDVNSEKREDNAPFSTSQQLSTSFPHFDSGIARSGVLHPGIVGEKIGGAGRETLDFAFDLGTTTISVRVSDAEKTYYEKTVLNAQRVYGADVISRIACCADETGLAAQSAAVRGQIYELLAAACGELELDIQAVAESSSVHHSIAVAGNTAMLYILCGIQPAELGRSPYIPSVRFGGYYDIEIHNTKLCVYLPPCSGGFTGGDLTCCLAAVENGVSNVENSGITVETEPQAAYPRRLAGWKTMLMCDLGTNGEIALFTDLHHGGKIYVTSAAAGPALEGGNISCGAGAVEGAITRVYESATESAVPLLGVDVIGGGEARYLSGGALLELAAVLLRRGIIDETGRMECGRFDVCGNVYLTQADVRQLQLAKGAVCAAAQRLLELSGIEAPDGIIITGGLGYRVSAETVRTTGLLPLPADSENILFEPALALDGAALCCSEGGRETARLAAERCACVELSEDDRFDELFIENMEFNNI